MRFALLLPLVPLAVLAQTCYWPNGKEAAGAVPCPPRDDKAYSACCSPGHYCLSNGLCMQAEAMEPYRGSCTDPTFRSQSCGQYCHNDDFDSSKIDGSSPVVPCGEGKFSCSRSSCGKSNFTVPAGRLQLNSVLVSDLGNAVPTVTASCERGGRPPWATGGGGGGGGGPPASTGGATTTPAGGQGTSAPIETPAVVVAGGLSPAAAAGVGVGVGVPLIVAAAALVLLFRREKRAREDLRRELAEVKSAGETWSPSTITSYPPLGTVSSTPVEAPVGFRRGELNGSTPPRHELGS